MFKLIIEDDEGKTTVVPLIRDEITIGRKEGNTIRLTERNVSRRHAAHLRQQRLGPVEDLGSYNGVKVNGNRIAGRVADQRGRSHPDRRLPARAQGRPRRARRRGAHPAAAADRARAEMPAAALEDTAERRASPRRADRRSRRRPHGRRRRRQAAGDRAGAAGGRRRRTSLGQEFPLDKAAVVIGRTDENDVVVNHRSISRHHAKIVREHGRYDIVDLQSANGVRVNGEEYGKVELRRGDLIDLGHVRLRFVEPGEDFVFERDVTAIVQMPPPRSRQRTILLVGLAVVCVAGGAFFAVRPAMFGRRTTVPAVANVGQPDAAALVPPVALGPDAQTKAVSPGGESAGALAEIDRLMKEERWELAVRRCGDALKQFPDPELARDKRARAQVEQRNQDALTVLSEAVDKGEPDRAQEAFKKILEDSVYRKRADDRWTRVRARYLATHLARAKKEKEEGRCDAMARDLDLVLAEDQRNAEAADLRKDCRAHAVAVGPKPKPPTKHPGEPAPTPPPEAPKGGQLDDDKAKALLDQSAGAYARGQSALAITLAQQAIKLTKKPGLLNRANANIVIGHCAGGRKDQAQKHANRLDPGWKAQVKSLCKSKGIELD